MEVSTIELFIREFRAHKTAFERSLAYQIKTKQNDRVVMYVQLTQDF